MTSLFQVVASNTIICFDTNNIFVSVYSYVKEQKLMNMYITYLGYVILWHAPNDILQFSYISTHSIQKQSVEDTERQDQNLSGHTEVKTSTP